MEFKLHNGSGGLCCKSCGRQDKQLNTYDWLADIPGNAEESEMVEIQFKNTRKGYFRNSNKIPLEKGDIVAVEATPGHDIGVVTLTGRLVPLQMRKANIKSEADIKRIYRKAKQVDMDKYNEAKAREHSTMIRARQIALGGIGPCGRELCCATWMTSFVSVSTSAARFQDISLNPQKLAGQCAKLKCCLNYEVDCYVEAQKRLPSKEIELETKDGVFYFFKADILNNQITYSTDKNIPANLVTISGRRAFEVIGLNKRGIKPDYLLEETHRSEPKKPVDLLEQESLTRFDRNRKNKNSGDGNNGNGNNNGNRNKKKKKSSNNRPQGSEQPATPQPQEQQSKPQGNEKRAQGDERRPQRNNNNRKRPHNNKPKPQGDKPVRDDKPVQE